MSTLLALALVPLAQLDSTRLGFSARMPDGPFEPGVPLELVVTVEAAPEGWWGDPAEVGIARPILHIDAPECVRLLGTPPDERVTPYDFELGYLCFPEGRKLHARDTHVAFELTRAPRPGERIGLSLVAWTDNDDPREARFVRLRLELEAVTEARAVPGDAGDTSWGREGTLAIGDRVEFTLPTHDGFELSARELAGAPFLVVTYRAHW